MRLNDHVIFSFDRCPKHHQEINLVCVFIDYCQQDNPCHHLSTCVSNRSNLEFGYNCVCKAPMEGQLCNIYKEPVVVSTASSTWIIGLVVGIIVLIISKSQIQINPPSPYKTLSLTL